MAALDDKRGIFGQIFEILLDQPVLHPVLAYTSGFTIGDQLVGVKRDFKVKVVVDHDLKGFAFDALAFVLVNGLSVDPSRRTEAVAVDSASCIELIQKLRDQLLMILRGNIAERVFQGGFGLCLAQAKASGGGSSDAFLKCRHLRKFIVQCESHIVFIHDAASQLTAAAVSAGCGFAASML